MEVDIINKFEQIYKLEADAIFRFCLMRVSDREQALDITQEVFLRLWQNLQQGKQIINNRAFLFTITRRLIIDWYRKKKSLSLDKIINEREEGDKDIMDNNTTQEKLYAGIEGKYFIDKINEIEQSYRDPLYLRFVEDLSPSEIGEILGITANAASVRVNRGLVELRKKSNE
jgi:RNA polymerase sigma-70 factor (ECF subfamily)